jgi:hypothetical protein
MSSLVFAGFTFTRLLLNIFFSNGMVWTLEVTFEVSDKLYIHIDDINNY